MSSVGERGSEDHERRKGSQRSTKDLATRSSIDGEGERGIARGVMGDDMSSTSAKEPCNGFLTLSGVEGLSTRDGGGVPELE